MRTFALKTLLFCLVTSLFFLTSCNPFDPVQDEESPEIAFDGRGPNSDCGGQLPFTPTYNIVSVDDYPGYDFALQVSGTSPEVPPGCTCGTTTYSIDLNVDYMFIHEVGLASSEDNSMDVDIVYEDETGFALEFRAPDGYNTEPDPLGGQGNNPYSVVIDAADGDILLFDFYGGTGGPNYNSSIDNAGGICIVDNIAKGNGR